MKQRKGGIFTHFPCLEFGEYQLREIELYDAEDYFNYISHEAVNRFIPSECIPKTIENAREEIEYMRNLFYFKRSIYWAIARRDSNKLIGSCGFNYWNHYHARAEISYDLARQHWRKGIMSKALSCVIAYGFSVMKLHRIEATITPDNVPSLTLLKRLAFSQEGILREQKLLHGRFCDAIMLSLLSSDYKDKED